MEKNTFQNKYISKFINDNYHAVKFNAEGNESINFMDKFFSKTQILIQVESILETQLMSLQDS